MYLNIITCLHIPDDADIVARASTRVLFVSSDRGDVAKERLATYVKEMDGESDTFERVGGHDGISSRFVWLNKENGETVIIELVTSPGETITVQSH